MRHIYRALFLALLSGTCSLSAQAQRLWQPFRPGLIYSYLASGSSSSAATYLLRLDSAFTTAAGDSAWAFNRLLRTADGSVLARFGNSAAHQSRNNLFGARQIWQPATGEFVLENRAEGNFQAAFSLRLRPQAAVGSSWAASTAPAVTATLTSRSWQPVSNTLGSVFDSVATITLSSGPVLRLSRRYGLLVGPRWLAGSNSPQWEVAQLPVAFVDSPVYPATVFNLQPGDLLGYAYLPRAVSSPPCLSGHTLRRVQTRQIIGDSLLYTYREQTRTTFSSSSACAGMGTPGTVVGPVRAGRLAFSLRTGQSPQLPALPLLSGEYRAIGPAVVVVGLGLSTGGASTCLTGTGVVNYQQMYLQSGASGPEYGTVSDGNWYQSLAYQTGVGDVVTGETTLEYYVKATANGGSVTCGSIANYATLLPTRAAQAAAVATLAPNPAADAATLTLAQPARPGTRLVLRDALGRTVWTAPVPAGQSVLPVPLAGRPAGLYVLHLSGPAATATLRLVKE